MQLRFTVLSLALAVLTGACGHREAGESGASTSAAASRSSAASASAGRPSTPGAPAPATAARGSGPCPPTGLWATCSLIKRLDEHGLAPRLDSGTVREDPLTIPGVRIHLGRAELEAFIYSDSASRKTDEARLDRKKFITPDQEPSLAGERTLIATANVIGLLKSLDDHQRERVSVVIMAGAPQP